MLSENSPFKPTYPFPRSRRVHGRTIFLLLRKSGRKKYSKNLGINYLKSTEDVQIGFAISKKVGNSVTRNRIRRIIREYLRTHPEILPKTGKILLSAHRRFSGWSLELEQQLRDLLIFTTID